MFDWKKTVFGGYREIILVALPLILANSCRAVNLFVDRMMLARYSSGGAAASFTGGLLNFTVSTLLLGTIGYAGTFVAQYYGSGQMKKIGLVIWQAMFLALAGGLLLASGVLWGEKLFLLFGHDPDVVRLETRYFQVLSAGAFVNLAVFVLGTFWSGRGVTRVALIVSIVIMCFNIPLNYIFIYGKFGAPELGVVGAALGTLSAEAVGLLIYFVMFMSKKNRMQYATSHLALDFSLIRRMLKYGIPNGVQLCLDMLSFTIFGLLLGNYGVAIHEGAAIAFGINNIAFCPIMGFGQTAGILVGQSIGAKDIPLAKMRVAKCFLLTTLYALLMVILFVFFKDLVLSPFVRPDDPAQALTIKYAGYMLLFISAYLIFDGASLTVSNALRGAGDTSFTMWAFAAVGMGLFALPCVILFSLSAPWWSLWVSLDFEIFLLSIVFFIRYRQGKWTGMSVI